MKASGTPEQLKPFFQGLRKYQCEAIDHLLQNFAAGRRRLLFAHPTGSGKNHIITRLPYILRTFSPNPRTLILTHLTTISDDIQRRFREYNAGLKPEQRLQWAVMDNRRRFNSAPNVVVAMMQHKDAIMARFEKGDFGTIIIDEAHHSLANTYIDILRHFGAFKGDPASYDLMVGVIGVTATPFRTDNRDMAFVWDRCPGPAEWGGLAHYVPIGQLIRQGYLVSAHGIRVVFSMNPDALKEDSIENYGLRDQYGSPGLSQLIVETYLTLFKTPRQTLVYCNNIDQANLIADLFNAYFTANKLAARDHRAAALHSRVPTEFTVGISDDEFRDLTLQEQFQTGKLRVLVSCQMIGEGFDSPNAEVIVIAKRTMSHVQWIQNLGRGMRPYPSPEAIEADASLARHSKKQVVVVDFFDNIPHFIMEESSRKEFVRDIFASLTNVLVEEGRVVREDTNGHGPEGVPAADFSMRSDFIEQARARALAELQKLLAERNQPGKESSNTGPKTPRHRNLVVLLRHHYSDVELLKIRELVLKSIGVDIDTVESPRLLKRYLDPLSEKNIEQLLSVGLDNRTIAMLAHVREGVVEAVREGRADELRKPKYTEEDRNAVRTYKAEHADAGPSKIATILGYPRSFIQFILRDPVVSERVREANLLRSQLPEAKERRRENNQRRRKDPNIRERLRIGAQLRTARKRLQSLQARLTSSSAADKKALRLKIAEVETLIGELMQARLNVKVT